MIMMKFRSVPLWGVALVLAVACISVTAADDDYTKDKQECAPQLIGLAPCIPYVCGNSKMPTVECCSSLKQVLNTTKKCLCLLIKYRNETDLGIKIDADLALSLPTVCHAASNISDCPAILHLAPNSPDAKVFTDFAKRHNTSSSPAAVATQPSSDSKASNGGASPSTNTHLGALTLFYGFAFVVILFLLSCPI